MKAKKNDKKDVDKANYQEGYVNGNRSKSGMSGFNTTVLKSVAGKSNGSLVKLSVLKKCLVTAISVISAFAMFTIVASATTIYVPEDGNQTIQQAVNNATGGDIIVVRDAYTGTKENIDVDVAHLTIRSENGPANCIVDALNQGNDVFLVTEDYVNISGFSVQNARWARGIQLYYVDHCNISGNNLLNNYDGIFVYYSNNNTLTSNIANENGGIGIHLYRSSNNTLTSNIANSNNYDGIYLYFSNDNMLINNTATGHKPLGGSFDVLILSSGDWEHQGELSFYNYETRQLPLKHDAGDLTLRLYQQGHDSAYADYIALKKDDTVYTPISAVNSGDNEDILHKIISPEYDVCDAWNSTLEIKWVNVPENTTLVMRAMEEDLGEGHGSPLYYPLLREGYTLTHTLVDDGGINVDGLLEESGEPDFSVFWRPDTPHPDGYTSGWLHSDNQYLCAAVEVNADNTPDEEDWGALFVMVNGELREFRVSCADKTCGTTGFQYTASVPYEHRIYEFKIPLSELNARIGDELHYGFGAYGTLACMYSGIALYRSGDNTLTKNTVTDNNHGIYLYGADDNNISCNLLYRNAETGFYLTGYSTSNTIEYNNIVLNGNYNEANGGWEWNFYNYQSDNVEAKNNYWGTVDSSAIAASINENTGNVDYEPFLDGPSPCAPDYRKPTPIAVPVFSSVGLLALIGILSVVLAATILRRRN